MQQQYTRVLQLGVLFFVCYATCAPAAVDSDRSKSFAKWYHQQKLEFSQNEISVIKKSTIVLVPGFLSTITIKAARVCYSREAKELFRKLLAVVDSRDFRRVHTRSQSPTSKNIEVIAKIIEHSPKKVLFIGHSKGGLDVVAALAARPELWPRVAGVIAVGAPFFGTPLIDQMSSSSALRWTIRNTLKLLGGDMASFLEFSPKICKEQAYGKAAQAFPFPVLAFTSELSANDEMSIPLLRPLHHSLRKVAAKNDGLIPTASGILPGLPFINYRGLDHNDGIVSWGSRGRKQQFMGALLKVFLEIQSSPASSSFSAVL
jgi:pimeloyl-ACP methyl ester carboxylesterase